MNQSKLNKAVEVYDTVQKSLNETRRQSKGRAYLGIDHLPDFITNSKINISQVSEEHKNKVLTADLNKLYDQLTFIKCKDPNGHLLQPAIQAVIDLEDELGRHVFG